MKFNCGKITNFKQLYLLGCTIVYIRIFSLICIMADEILKNVEMLPDEVEFVSDLKAIVYTAKAKAYQAADLYNVASNWLVGRRIVEQEQHGEARAKYGKHVIEIASLALTEEFGNGYSIVNLKSFRKFYLTFKYLQIGQTLSAQSADRQASKGQTLSDLYGERIPLYEKYADVTIREYGLTIEQTAEQIAAAVFPGGKE